MTATTTENGWRPVDNEPDHQSFDDARRRRNGTGRVPPHNLEAEESLLGAMLLSREAIASAARLLSPEAFYKPSHGYIYAAVLRSWSRGDAVDRVTVAEELRRDGYLEQIGGQDALVTLEANTPAIGNVSRYAAIVRDHHLLRRLIAVAGQIAETGYSVPEDVLAAIDQAEASLFAVRPETESVVGRTVAEGLSERLDAIDAMIEAGGHVERPTGFTDLDELTAGLHPSTLTLVAGRPGMGKSSFGLAVAHNVARSGRPVVFVSVEMSEADLLDRLIAAETGLSGADLRRGKVSFRDRERLGPAAAKLSELPLFVVDAASATLLTVRAELRRAQARLGPLGLVVIDYVQIMRGAKSENRQVEVAQLAQGTRAIAREMRIPVWALAQLSRSLEARADKRPQLADLRESGDLENTADVVIGLYRDEVYKPNSQDRGVAEVIVLKQRQGPQGTVRLAADLRTGRWLNLARNAAL